MEKAREAFVKETESRSLELKNVKALLLKRAIAAIPYYQVSREEVGCKRRQRE